MDLNVSDKVLKAVFLKAEIRNLEEPLFFVEGPLPLFPFVICGPRAVAASFCSSDMDLIE